MFYALLLATCAAQTPEVPIETQVSAMVMVGFRGQTLDALGSKDAEKVGSVVLFEYDLITKKHQRNVANPEQLAILTAALRRANRRIWVAVDQEGGYVRRLKEPFGFGRRPTARSLGAQGVGATGNWARQTAQALAKHGIDMNFAPVVDLRLNPNNPVIAKYQRSYGENVDTVVAHAKVVISAHRAAGVVPVLKHFPGHGSSAKDSHEGLVDITATWQSLELEPYKQLIAQGLCDAIMTAHVFHRKLDPQHPATLSRAIIEGTLRKDLGFSGVVISDDLQMPAIAERYSLKETIRLAVEAGVDILMFANNITYDPAMGARARQVLMELVQDGTLSRERIEQSYRRIRALDSVRSSPSEN